MPASNMGSAGGSNAQVSAAASAPVIASPWSGPTNSPLDAANIDYTTGSPPGWNATTKLPIKANAPTNYSTGALTTGIGFGIGLLNILNPNYFVGGPGVSNERNFSDNATPGVTLPNGAAATDARLMAIGGGRSAIVAGTGANGNGTPTNEVVSTPNPWTGGFGVQNFGHGASRDAGAGPVFTGFNEKLVTATGAVAEGAAIEAGWVNRTGRALVTGESANGSATAASAALA